MAGPGRPRRTSGAIRSRAAIGRGLALDEGGVAELGRRVDLQLVGDVEIVNDEAPGQTVGRHVRVEVAERRRMGQESGRQEDAPEEGERGSQSCVLVSVGGTRREHATNLVAFGRRDASARAGAVEGSAMVRT